MILQQVLNYFGLYLSRVVVKKLGKKHEKIVFNLIGDLTMKIFLVLLVLTVPVIADVCNHDSEAGNLVLCEKQQEERLRKLELRDGLIAHYPFDGNANDASGNGNHGDVHGATLTKDRFGNADSAYNFDGIEDYIAINDTPRLNIINAITLSAWFKSNLPTSEHNIWSHIISKADECHSEGNYNLGLFSGNRIQFNYWEGTGVNNQYQINTVITQNFWHNIIVTYNYTNFEIKFYLDGVHVNGNWYQNNIPDKKVPKISSNKLSIGANLVAHSVASCSNVEVRKPISLFNGIIDDIRIYNRALSDSEIQSLYNQGN
jgi:hypothetical protein